MSVILATAGYDHKIKFWEAPSAVSTKTLTFPDSQVNRLEITPDKQFLAAAGNPHIHLYEINGVGGGTTVGGSSAQGPVLSCEGHTGNVTSLGFQIHGRWMFSGSEDGTLKVFDLRSPSFQRSFDARSPVRSVALHPNQLQLVSGDASGSVKVWDLRQQSTYINVVVPDSIGYGQAQQQQTQQQVVHEQEQQFQTQEQQMQPPIPPSSVGIGVTNVGPHATLATPSSAGAVTGAVLASNNISPFHYNHGSASTTVEGSINAEQSQNQRQHSTSEGSVIRKAPQTHAAVPIQAVTINEHLLVAANNHGQVFVWDHVGVPTGLSNNGTGSNMDHTTHSNVHQGSCVMHNNAPVSMINLRPVKSFTAHPPGSYCLQAKLSPDGRHLVTTSSDWTARLWDTNTWGLSSTLARHTKWVWDAVFSADSSYLVTASSDASARLWNLRSGDVVRQYTGHQGAVTCVALNDNST